MDFRTKQTLLLIDRHLKIRKYLTAISYFLIVGSVLVYFFIAFANNNKTYKLVADYAKNSEQYKTEKVMTNPRIKFQYNQFEVYDIKAVRASHKDEEEVMLYDVYANGKIGNITAGELKISERGNRLIFTKNPVLILNE